ncbi:MAG: PD-(D/E)XK nuclease family protein, partial [Bacteriovoracaceae bacterium]
LSKIVDFDYHKVFCVGDIKQAIYGFRGGELGVFMEMQKNAPLNLNLLNNYRSDNGIIEFNNQFFSHLFKLGLNFEGKDHYAVEVAEQSAPLPERDLGKIFEIDGDLSFLEDGVMGENWKKLSVSDIEYLEALALVEHVKNTLADPDNSVAVLYRKLKPSKTLMQLLLAANVGFTSQVKVPMLEDPALGIFHLLIKSDFDRGKLKDNYLEFSLMSYFKLLGKESGENVLKEAKRFQTNREYFGAYQSFLLFLSASGLVVSNYKNNLENIKLLIEINQGDLEKVAHKMDDWSGLNYSMEFQYGKDPHRVSIMSAHASKGLEFSQVLLGGVYTNDNPSGMKDMFGKTPYSFKWSKSLEEKKKFKTPHYMLEQAVQTHKEFSESKRLFYVACTRAENALGWARLNFGNLKATTVKGSWIHGIDHFFQESPEGKKQKDIVRAGSVSVDVEAAFDSGFLKRVSNQPPMFHFDNLGVEERLEFAPPFLLPELSVTRLAQITQCPRKFYLKNVLKLEGAGAPTSKPLASPGEEDLEELSSKSFSSAQRGIEVHDAISQTILNGFKTEAPAEFARPTQWVVEKLKAFGDKTRLISEKPIKFELFQYMISGIPDLIVSNERGRCLEIWDFKTGAIRGQTPENYWFQLYAYAYSQFHGPNSQEAEKPIKLVLCYVDEQKMLEKTVSKENVDKYLWRFCQKLNAPDEIDTSHCSQCDFDKICQKKSVSSCATSFSC